VTPGVEAVKAVPRKLKQMTTYITKASTQSYYLNTELHLITSKKLPYAVP
jgi:hypothetical protein